MSFFELRSPRDMLEKARREYQRLVCNLDIDNMFNFFVTAYHIKDYIDVMDAVENEIIEQFFTDFDMMDCRSLCNKGKHLTLTRSTDPRTVVWSNLVGGAPFGVIPPGGDSRWMLFTGGREVDVKRLAERVLAKWGKFFEENGL